MVDSRDCDRGTDRLHNVRLVFRHLGRRKSFTLFSLIMTAGLALTALCWAFFYQAPVALLGLMVMTVIGTGTWSNFGPMFSELFPTGIRTTALNTLLNLARATQFVTPLLVGALSATYGFKSDCCSARCSR